MSGAPDYSALLTFGILKLPRLKTGLRMQDLFTEYSVGLQPSMNGNITTELNRQ